ncbi:MAG: DUF1887 family protein [Candidatus Marinimicrobia bacterium]|nr:DUF1887 family protein [Candidatus Neomarinimicrobiota bacterium]
MALLEVCLVDESPLSAYLGAVLRKPDAVLWLRRNDQKNVVNHLETTLAGQLSASYENREIKSDVDEFSEQCRQIIKDYPDHDILFNATCGDRLRMLLAADVFKKAGKEIFFIDMVHSRLVNIESGEKKTFQLTMTVNEYTALHGVEIESGVRFDPEIGKRSGLSYFIGNNLEQIIPFIDSIRPEWNNMGDDKKDIQWRMDGQYHRFLINYESSSKKMRFKFGNSENQKTVEIPNDGGNYLFNGGWLRELVFLRVHRSQYDDVRLDVRLQRDSLPEGVKAESMLDITMMKGCHFYIFQCFSYPITRESFIELKAVEHSVKLLNATGFIFLAHRPHRGFVERARDYGINVIYGRRIPNFSL